jgi:hypothetical protein
VYVVEPVTRIRFVGQAPLEATVYAMERLRCNGCGQVVAAPGAWTLAVFFTGWKHAGENLAMC